MDWPTLWETIRAADAYSAADELGIPLEEVETGVERPHSGRRLYRIGADAYVLAMPAAPVRGERTPLSFYWAASEGAVQRSALGLRDADDDAIGDPPPELLIEPGLLTRVALQGWIGEHQPRYVEEGFAGFSPLSGTYVRIGQLVYHFRSIRWDPAETPYSVEYDPRPAEELFQKLGAFYHKRQ